MLLIIFEGIVCCFIVLLSCAYGIANGAENMVFFYDEKVQKRCIENGLITEKKIKRNKKLFMYLGILPYFIFVLVAVFFINKACGFWQGFYQMSAVLLIEGVFDRMFIDWYWVNQTKAWIIPGTEDFRPYIDKQAFIKKWTGTIIGFPIISAVISAITSLVLK